MSSYMTAQGSEGTYVVLVRCGICGVNAITDHDPIECPACDAKASKSEISADGGHDQFEVFKSENRRRG